MTSLPRRWQVGTALMACAAVVAGALGSSPPAAAQEKGGGAAEVAAVEIPSEAEALRRWLTIWDVNDLVLLFDEFYRQLGPVRMCPTGNVASQSCYLDFTGRGDGGGAVALGGEPADDPAADDPQYEDPDTSEPSSLPEASADGERPGDEPERPGPEPEASAPAASSPTASPEPRPSRPSSTEAETDRPPSPTELIEQRMTELVNAAREREGLPPLEVDVTLVSGARTWSASMSVLERLTHDINILLPLGARIAGENVAFRTTGDDVADKLHQQFMDSPEHRRNVLNPSFGRLGIGVVQFDDLTWVTQRFAG